jgi:hypothetical protein
MSDAEARAKIEHELEILRTRYALMQKWGRITQWFFVITTGVIALIAICAFVIGNVEVGGVCLLVLLAVAFCAVYQWGRRWIDMISPPPRAWRTWPTTTSEARAIEMMIAEREQRLHDLTQPT